MGWKRSAGLEASNVLGTSPCRIYKLRAYNGNAAVRTIMLFDAIELPADETVPVASMQLGIGEEGELDFGETGLRFGVGCVVATSSTVDDLGIGAADAIFQAEIRNEAS